MPSYAPDPDYKGKGSQLEFTVEDPGAFTTPWKATITYLRSGNKAVHPFHWEIEFPEVFSRENGGFDAMVGNPPFAPVTRPILAGSNAESRGEKT